MTRALKAINIAGGYLGQLEIQPNKGFKDSAFAAKMVAVGWLQGQAWCSYFAKLVFEETYADVPVLLSKVKRLGIGSAIDTLLNYEADKTFTCFSTPKMGAIVIFREGDSHSGHAGIVTGVFDTYIHTIEGNTNTDGSRDGYLVARKTRLLNQPHNPNGLNIAGFIYPIEC